MAREGVYKMNTIFGIPVTLLSSAFGAIMGFIVKSSAQNLEVEAAKHKHTIEAMAAQSENYVRQVQAETQLMEAKAKFEERLHAVDPNRSEARRNIAYFVTVGLVFFLPWFLYQTGIDWIYSFEYEKTTGFWLWERTRTVLEAMTIPGLPVEWLWAMLEIFAGIISFYFGGSLAKYDNPYRK